MQRDRQRAYDRGITTFSPDGRLYQVEYAREAIRQGEPSIGITTQTSTILLVDKGRGPNLREERSVEKLHKADDHIGVASAGHVADGRQLIDFARRQAQINKLRYDEPISIDVLTQTITDHIQEFTQSGGVRPFGAALLIGGMDDGEPRLFSTDPGGTPEEWAATAIGGEHRAILDILESDYHEELSHSEGLELGFRALSSVNDDSLSADKLGVVEVSSDTQGFVDYDHGEIEQYLREFELDADENG